ncbi:hypothetical protein KSD_01420 [Ktedonobacter sp. SOSP1-85]|uniref:hypothetical protein n=1 Tax=Ktedonobacter sp. SOSP1-85 TaxID=2778367 RepID=UPI0019168041|nr:hypothetical protein KSD_01420 [Ktedonobacter sp. SOSP1-85]
MTATEARRTLPVPMHRTTVYRLLKRVEREGEQALAERRHGYPTKLRGEVLTWMLDYCQNHRTAASSEVQRLVAERFGLSVSVSQLNRVRAAHGLSRQAPPREKTPKTGLMIASGHHEQAGGLLLLAAATETGLLTPLEQALPPAPDSPCLPMAGSPAVRRRLVLTLLFLGAVGLQRTWDLRGYTADSLALLTGRTRAYGYRYTEAFLSQVARADGAERITEMLGSWATHLWHPTEAAAEAERPHCLQALTCYVDGHRKPVYSDVLLPRGLVGRLSVVLGCRALLLLHDEQGHPLFVTTHRGDQHLTAGVPALLERYEQQVQTSHVARMIVDREGMATEFLARLHAEGRIVVTILQTNQYRDLSSFSDVGPFEPLSMDTHGQVIREVAPARITLPREKHPDDPLRLQVALIRDLRRKVETRPDPEKTEYPRRWDGDLSLEEQAWWREGWKATAAPAKATTAKLIPIVTTEAIPTIDAVELAQTYIHRWPAQENVIKDYLRPLGLDTNHGFAKIAVENSEVTKRRTRLEQRIVRLKQWAQSAGKREALASRRRERLRQILASRSKESYQELWAYQRTLEEQGVANHVLRREVKERKAIADAELEQLRAKEWHAYEQCNAEFRKQERYCKEQCEVLRALEDLKEQARTMYELDNRKDQIMTVCKVAMANLAMWVRDQYFPPSYAHATWKRLLPFFQLPGTITQNSTMVQAELRPFNDRALNRDLVILCERVNQASPRLPDGGRLSFTIQPSCCVLAAQKVSKTP